MAGVVWIKEQLIKFYCMVVVVLFGLLHIWWLWVDLKNSMSCVFRCHSSSLIAWFNQTECCAQCGLNGELNFLSHLTRLPLQWSEVQNLYSRQFLWKTHMVLLFGRRQQSDSHHRSLAMMREREGGRERMGRKREKESKTDKDRKREREKNCWCDVCSDHSFSMFPNFKMCISAVH